MTAPKPNWLTLTVSLISILGAIWATCYLLAEMRHQVNANSMSISNHVITVDGKMVSIERKVDGIANCLLTEDKDYLKDALTQ